MTPCVRFGLWRHSNARCGLRPDFIKASTTAFSQWHYIDLPYAPAGDGGRAPACGEAQNIVWALENAAAVLRSAKSDPWARSTMVRFLIHFMGDLHQVRALSTANSAFPPNRGGDALSLRPPRALAAAAHGVAVHGRGVSERRRGRQRAQGAPAALRSTFGTHALTDSVAFRPS